MKFNTLINFLNTIFFVSIIFGCAKENIIEQPQIDNFSGRKIRYIIHVVAAENISFKSTQNVDSAKVSIVINGKTHTQTLDSQHIAVFDYLYSGSVIVKVDCKGYTSVGFIADLRSINDSNAVYDSDNFRIVSAIVTLLPLNNSYVNCTIFGNAYAQLDSTTSDYENAPENINIAANVFKNDLQSLIVHSQDCKITNIYYTGLNVYSKTNANGSFDLVVPTTCNGLRYIIRADDFTANQLIAPNIFQTKVFSYQPDTIVVFSNINKIHNIFLKSN